VVAKLCEEEVYGEEFVREEKGSIKRASVVDGPGRESSHPLGRVAHSTKEEHYVAHSCGDDEEEVC
jgi:hypothetical protein